MGSLFSKIQRVKYFLYAKYHIFLIYAWVKSFKDKTSKTVLNSFIGILNKSKLKQNKLWVDQGR